MLILKSLGIAGTVMPLKITHKKPDAILEGLNCVFQNDGNT